MQTVVNLEEQAGKVVRRRTAQDVDLMQSACGVSYAEAIRDAAHRDVGGVPIPFASPLTLWKMKQTPREKDIADRLSLRQLLEAQGITVDPKRPAAAGLRNWLRRVLSG